MTRDFVIRQAVEADEPAIRACALDAYEPYVAVIGKTPAPMVADFRSSIASGFAHVAVAADHNVIGFIIFVQRDDCVLLENVAVRSSAAKQGVGKQLIAFCEDEAKRPGAGSVKLYTNAKMAENLSTYPYLGYREVERIREDGFNRVYFEKPV